MLLVGGGGGACCCQGGRGPEGGGGGWLLGGGGGGGIIPMGGNKPDHQTREGNTLNFLEHRVSKYDSIAYFNISKYRCQSGVL